MCVFCDGSQYHVVDAAQSRYGMLPYLLGKIGINDAKHALKYDMGDATVIFVTVWKGFGYTLTILSAALGVPESLYEAAEIDGATGLQKFSMSQYPVYGIRSVFAW